MTLAEARQVVAEDFPEVRLLLSDFGFSALDVKYVEVDDRPRIWLTTRDEGRAPCIFHGYLDLVSVDDFKAELIRHTEAMVGGRRSTAIA